MLARALLVVGVLTVCLPLGARVAAAAPAWVEVTSPHFTVISDASERRARDVAWQFEQVRAAIARLWPWATVDFPLPVVVYAARDERSMKSLVPEYFEGRSAIRPDSVFVSGVSAHHAVVRSDVRLDSRGDVNPFRSSYWSYLALVLQSSFNRELPLWFTRGLAEVFSNTVVSDDELKVGQVIPWHLERLRQTERMELETVLAVDRSSPEMKNPGRMALFDASAWGLVHYLLFGNKGQNIARMNELSTAIGRGADPNESVARIYGGLRAVRAGLAVYIDQGLYLYQKVPADLSVDRRAFAARPMTAAQASVAIARLHFSMDRPLEARARIADAPADPAAAEVEGMLLEREDKRDEARAAYARASEAGAASFYGEYRLAWLLLPKPGSQADFAPIEKVLRRSVALNPQFARSHVLLVHVLLRQNRAAEAAPLARRAVQLAPRLADAHEWLARTLAMLGKRDEALASAKRALGLAVAGERDEITRLVDDLSRPVAPSPAPAAVGAPSAAAPGSAAPPQSTVESDGRSCEAGDLAACGRLFSAAEEACGRGVNDACGAAAHLLAEGRGVVRDANRAMALLERPCTTGEWRACTYLARLLLNRGTDADLARARELLDKSCQGGQSDACSALKHVRKP